MSNNNTSQKKKVRSAAAMEKRAAKWSSQKAAKKASALATRNAKKAEEERKQKSVLAMFPDIMGIVGAQGFMPNVKKSVLTSKTMRNTLKSVPLFEMANRGTIYPNGQTMLSHYLAKGQYDEAMDLLDKNLPKRILDHAGNFGLRPLEFAFQESELPLFKKLLEKGANPNAMLHRGPIQVPLLTHILLSSHPRFEEKKPYIDELLKHKANINLESSEKKRPIDYAIHKHRISLDLEFDSVKYLIDKGAQLETPNEAGFTPVLTAVIESDLPSLIYMIDKKKVDLNKKTGKAGLFPLKLAVTNGNIAMLKFLLEKNVDINQKDEEGNTALHYAVLTNALQKISLLKQKGAKPNIANKKGDTPLKIAQALQTAGDPRAYEILIA